MALIDPAPIGIKIKELHGKKILITMCLFWLWPGSFFNEGDSKCVAFFIEQICEVYIKVSLVHKSFSALFSSLPEQVLRI